nr:aldo/keto reductase [Paenibacillus xylanexedens]
MEYVTLNNGVQMPILGYGVYQIPDQDECEKCVLDAISVGYRSIDTAQAYRNEEAVGRAIQKSGVPREEFFITTKVWISNAGYERAKASIEESLRKLQLDYLDLLLIHQPFNDYYGTYRAMEEYYKAGKIRAIGVSNFYPDRYIDLVQFSEVVPAVNQVETHVFNQQAKAHEIMKKYNTQIESWGPFAEGRKDLFTNATLQEIGNQYNKSTAQVALRFLIQRGVVVIPKTVNKDRMEQNLNVFDFQLTAQDMEKITALDTEQSAFFSHYDPQTVEFLTDYGKKGLE